MALIPVQLAGRSYEVRVGTGLLYDLAVEAKPFLRKRYACIVADANARRSWGETVGRSLEAAGIAPRWYDVAPGEASKSWESLAGLTDWLLKQNVERGDHVFALGGGVVGDLTGFACAILKRGCGFVQLPTTLLAQVDSSVGGKTAINTSAGKNLVGAFHQPSLVLADLDTLSTLPSREVRAGYAEVLKYGVLGDNDFFEWLEDRAYSVLALQRQSLEEAVARSVRAKARIVAEDERETSGARALLNLGHTFGHALEAETGFSDKLLHGEAVALGMVLAARYSARQGLMGGEDAERVTRAVDAAGLPAEISALDLCCTGAALTAHMLHDKKMDAGSLPFVLLRGIGAAYLDGEVNLADVAAFLDEQLQAH
ncbi:3-dehydroquinate synthase [Qipengyuania qiaonensis]|uniref:3-dehydroquinate synthase n=1 Tax=Qipengyuania qiaonensis TaxID=2867240 RepID=A0ABS7J0U2_9SPHN|nr:3-dehydroquinate synthase [Qipengyuania qiaonensis]MBX7480970.1 3-dehydroquinate synthase [Qipengyuania qiaonensis]